MPEWAFPYETQSLRPKTRAIYLEAFVRFWAWAGCNPPDDIRSIKAYDRLLAEYVEFALEIRTPVAIPEMLFRHRFAHARKCEARDTLLRHGSC